MNFVKSVKEKETQQIPVKKPYHKFFPESVLAGDPSLSTALDPWKPLRWAVDDAVEMG